MVNPASSTMGDWALIKELYISKNSGNATYEILVLLLKTEKKVTDLVKCKHKTFVDYV
jgi:hypothetical protein